MRSAEFVPVKLKKGLCETCLELALLAEKNAEVDSHGVCPSSYKLDDGFITNVSFSLGLYHVFFKFCECNVI